MSQSPAPVSTAAELTAAFAILKQRGVTQTAFAAEIGRSQTQVSQWKAGKYPVPRFVGAHLRSNYRITAATVAATLAAPQSEQKAA